jgi:acyl carrier protein
MSESSLRMNGTSDVAEVKAAVIETLGIEDGADALDATTPLASVAEFDSMAVVALLVELEHRFDITVEDEDVTAEVFETIGSLAAFVHAKAG